MSIKRWAINIIKRNLQSIELDGDDDEDMYLNGECVNLYGFLLEFIDMGKTMNDLSYSLRNGQI